MSGCGGDRGSARNRFGRFIHQSTARAGLERRCRAGTMPAGDGHGVRTDGRAEREATAAAGWTAPHSLFARKRSIPTRPRAPVQVAGHSRGTVCEYRQVAAELAATACIAAAALTSL